MAVYQKKIVFAAMVCAICAMSSISVFAETMSAQPATPANVGRGPDAIPQIEQQGPVTNMAQSEAALQQMVAASGTMQTAGDYKVALILAPPRGWYMPSANGLVWRPPARNETQHIEVVIMDSLTSKPLPSLPTLDVLDGQGRVIQSQKLMYVWHPQADHYGGNYSVPEGTYTIRVTAPPPIILHHSRELGNRFTKPLSIQFTGVQITPAAPLPAELGTGAPAGAGPAQPTSPGAVCPPGSTQTP